MNFNKIVDLDHSYVMQTYARLPVSFVKGKGTRLWDDEGREYLDFVAGLGVVNVGHCHPRVVKAIHEQASRLIHVSNLYFMENQVILAKTLSALAFGGRAFFGNSGAEANEGAIKLTRKYAKSADSGRHEIITAYRSFHGRTMKTLAATGQPEKQRPFEPLPPGFVHVPLNNLTALEAAISDKTSAILLEPIQGEGGVHQCDFDYLRAVRRICDERDILLILDEVQTGIGRTGRFFAYQHYGIEPDILTMAKGLASGMPIGAVVAKERVASSFTAGDHGSTFGGGPVVTAAAIATLNVIQDEGLVENAAKVGDYFKSGLEALAERKGFKEVRGRGLMLAIELGEARAKAGDIVRSLLVKRRIIVNAIGETTLRFLPPLAVTESEVDEVLAALESEV
ncbi:MAG: acetylornithine transaminase [Actinobacteria bacterium]|nr:acetylornithine transaminase [Actinomycetota bacterium]